ncbi:hypothetical protein [Pseudomonas putida]|uniref:Uncharacterized protein n=1 Tax=Pseudomonas putida S13.1.2 TaxID=1384061 RepID=A0AAU8RWK7_PSEPU|nr:hypothetical protein [Pseudomonas putida]AJQ47661.1 hypothetical protein N805_10710 [Pseudomonas putida S13.1.2]
MKRVTDQISKKQIYLLSFAAQAPAWFIVFAVVFPLAWYFSGSGLLGFASGVGLPAFLIRRSANKRIELANQLLEEVHHKTLASLGKVDYYHYGADGSLAVDVAAGQLAFIKVLPTMEILAPIVISVSDIIEFYYYDPGMTTTKYYGRDISTAQEVLMDNLSQMHERAKVRGLHIQVDNVQAPRIVVTMTVKEADHWVLIVRKLLEQSLEVTSSPVLVP